MMNRSHTGNTSSFRSEFRHRRTAKKDQDVQERIYRHEGGLVLDRVEGKAVGQSPDARETAQEVYEVSLWCAFKVHFHHL